jgi:glycosyltransferase involved in cell wall biosynthesis
MRLLIEISGQIDDWHLAFDTATDRPRLPLPYSSSAAFIARGHEVSAIHFSDEFFSSREKGRFSRLYGPRQLREAIADNDLVLLWAGSAIKAFLSNRALSREKKLLFASYVWRVPPEARWKARLLGVATRTLARRARSAVFMTHEQVREAMTSLSVPIVPFTWGIDSAFYRHPSTEADPFPALRDQLKDLLSTPYVILAGDQQRLDSDAVALVEHFDLRLVRVPQEQHTAEWYRRQIKKRGLEGRIFVFQKVTYAALRFLLQHATAYVGLVDSSWQPAGWTVLCESIASGIPAIVYDGLTAREMRRLGAGDYLMTVPSRDIQAVATCYKEIRDKSEAGNELTEHAQHFSKSVLDLEQTAANFVDSVEAVYSPARSRRSGAKVLLAHPGTQHSLLLHRPRVASRWSREPVCAYAWAQGFKASRQSSARSIIHGGFASSQPYRNRCALEIGSRNGRARGDASAQRGVSTICSDQSVAGCKCCNWRGYRQLDFGDAMSRTRQAIRSGSKHWTPGR